MTQRYGLQLRDLDWRWAAEITKGLKPNETTVWTSNCNYDATRLGQADNYRAI